MQAQWLKRQRAIAKKGNLVASEIEREEPQEEVMASRDTHIPSKMHRQRDELPLPAADLATTIVMKEEDNYIHEAGIEQQDEEKIQSEEPWQIMELEKPASIAMYISDEDEGMYADARYYEEGAIRRYDGNSPLKVVHQ